MDILAALTAQFHLRPSQVENTVKLIDDGNTIPFIARYRKEVTGSLDDQVLRELADRKTTMIIVTHEMHFARDVADRILFMDGGVVVEEGPAKQLIDHPREQRTKQFLAHYAE